ncbi:hypothetical protein F5J12DRAFT_697466, partial [Pisolithus orientalis]|uniref:uncharacterized protein n=1 Tax=Pisolithus orientalis TaxID=936130 RepID=UPI002224AC92
GFIRRCIIGQIMKGDTVSVLDIMQRHHDAPGHMENITDEWDVLDVLKNLGVTCIIQNTLLQQGMKDLSIYIKINIKGTGAIIDTAITAGDHRLIYMSSASVVFNGTCVMNINGQVPSPEKLFNACNNAHEIFRPREYQMEDGAFQAYWHGTCLESIVNAHILRRDRLTPHPSYSSTTPSKLRLDPKSVAAMLNELLHHALPPMCAITEYHHTVHSSLQLLSPYVTSTSNTESILSAFNTP